MTLTPAEQRIVEALQLRGLTLGDSLDGRLLLQIALELHLSRPTLERHIATARGELRSAGLLVRRRTFSEGAYANYNAVTGAEAKVIRESRSGTRAMLCEELRRFGQDVEQGGTREQLLARLNTLRAWVETL